MFHTRTNQIPKPANKELKIHIAVSIYFVCMQPTLTTEYS